MNLNDQKNKDKNENEIYLDGEEENKELKEFLNSDEDSCLNNSITERNKEEDKNNKEKDKFKKDIDKALLYLVLFLKQKNIQIKNKEILYKLLNNINFKNGIEYLKSKINKNKKEAENLGIISSKKNITNGNIINYLYKIFMDKNSPYHIIFENSEDYIQNVNWNNLQHFKNYKNIYSLIENEEKIEKQRKLKKLAAYNKQIISELRNEELKLEEKRKKQKIKRKKEIKRKKIENKGKGLSYDVFKDIYENDKDAALNELALTNELKYQIKMADDDDSKERFKYLYNQIEKLKNYDIKEYINSIKEDFNNYKGEIQDLIHVKDMEQRINNFVNCLSSEREINILSRNKMKNKFSIKDGIFESSLINCEDNEINK